jgi:hypothetical protein
MPVFWPKRKEWRLPSLAGDWVLIRRSDLIRNEEVNHDPPFLAADLSRWNSDHFSQRILLDLCRELWGDTESWARDGDPLSTLLPRMEQEFRRGSLVLVRPHRQFGVSSGGGAAAAAPAAKSKEKEKETQADPGESQPRAKKKTWVGFHLRDESGQPVTNERYSVTLPDKSIKEGRLNSSGEVYFEEIDPGQCSIMFPDIDAKEWTAI